MPVVSALEKLLYYLPFTQLSRWHVCESVKRFGSCALPVLDLQPVFVEREEENYSRQYIECV
jgi:hypothetical protein